MARHSLAEILIIVLAVCGALAMFSLIGTWLVRLTTRGTPPGGFGITFAFGGISTILFSVLIVAVIAIVVALAVSLKSKR